MDGARSGTRIAWRVALGGCLLAAVLGVVDSLRDSPAVPEVVDSAGHAPASVPASRETPLGLGTGSGLPVVVAGQPIPCGDWVPCEAGPATSAAYLPERPLLDPAQPVRHGSSWVFPLPGVYRLTDGNSQHSVLAVGASAVENVLAAFSFAAGAASGASAENEAFGADRDGFTRSLFRRSQPAALACGPTAQIMGRLLDVLGIEHRLVQWVGESARYLAHQSLEVRLPEQGWTLYDPHLGLAFAPGLSALEVFERARAGEALETHVTTFVAKATWEDEPRETYARYDTALGHFDGGRIALLVGDPELLAALGMESWSAHPVERLEHDQFFARFYAADDQRTTGPRR